jgi:hypothetical protein
MERRSKPRIEYPFPVTVRGVDATGKPFRVNGLLDNISASGLYMRLKRTVMTGTRLLCVIRFASPISSKEAAARIATRGVVVRAEPFVDEKIGIAVKFTDYRFL